MYAGIIIWSLCGGCRSAERLYFLKYCNPHLFCFFTRNTALRSLLDYNALGRTVALNAAVLFPHDFSTCVAASFLSFPNYFKIACSCSPFFTASVSLVSFTFSFNFHSLGCLVALPKCKTQIRSCLWLKWGTGSTGYTHLTLLETWTAQRKEVFHLILRDKVWLKS